MMMMTSINHFLLQPPAPYSSWKVGTACAESSPALLVNSIMAQVNG